MWYFSSGIYDDWDDWKPYDQQNNQIIINAFEGGHEQVQFQVEDHTHTINFKENKEYFYQIGYD